eukprot:NODE_11415_length_1288_cov_4.511628.p2 GENE.NODE_11415_length_1288_cov_4.511628~~NODE_11415_length_1288_cov_4.511628.p2  ORF type:complete len:117 (-),score=6.04 NODE_11415_length_1288_cov_4.511628:357-707(-)
MASVTVSAGATSRTGAHGICFLNVLFGVCSISHGFQDSIGVLCFLRATLGVWSTCFCKRHLRRLRQLLRHPASMAPASYRASRCVRHLVRHIPEHRFLNGIFGVYGLVLMNGVTGV